MDRQDTPIEALKNLYRSIDFDLSLKYRYLMCSVLNLHSKYKVFEAGPKGNQEQHRCNRCNKVI